MHRLTHIALPLLVFAAGFGVGAWFPGREDTNSPPVGGRRFAENVDAAPTPAAKDARAFSTDEEMLTAIMSAVAEEKPLLRAHRLHEFLGRLGPAELATLFARTARIEERERRDDLLGAVLGRWANVDFAGAAAAVRAYRDRFRASAQLYGRDGRGLDAAVNTAWTRAQPEAALAEALAAPDALWAQYTAYAAIESLADGEPARQLETLARLPASRLRDGLCGRAITALAEKDSAAAEASLALLSDPRQRGRLQAEILGKLAEQDATVALARFATLARDLTPSTNGTRMVSAVLHAAAKKDPAAALAAVADVPEELRSQALGAALRGWAGVHPVEALAWAAANGLNVAQVKAVAFFGSSDATGWYTLSGTAFDSDRTKTLAWLRTQPASLARDQMLISGMSDGTMEQRLEIYAELTPPGRAGAASGLTDTLYREDPKRAEAWAKAQPPGPARRDTLSTLAVIQANNVPERRGTLAEEWPAGADRDAVLRGLAWSAYSEPLRALEFARRVGDRAIREQLLERIAQSWSYRDAPATRAWLVSAPELSPEQKRVMLRQLDER